MSDDDDDNSKGTMLRPTAPLLITPMPFVWGVCAAGEFWWNVQADRFCTRAQPDMVDLFEGTLCDNHGLEGKLIGFTAGLREAFAWVAGGPLPDLLARTH